MRSGLAFLAASSLILASLNAAAQTPPPAPPAPAPAPTPAPPPKAEWTSLRILHEKGMISDAEYASALQEMGTMGAPDSNTFVASKLKVTIYGFVQADFAYDATESCFEFCSNFQIQKPGTYKGDHGRTMFSVRDSRFGLRLAAPEAGGVRAVGLLEGDFFGPSTTSEQGTWVNPVFRIRHAYLKFETPVVDVLLGQTWSLYGWQANYLVTSVQEPGLPGQMFARTPQLRVSKTFKSDAVDVELAIGVMRPPQMDSETPEGVAGVRVAFNEWTGLHTLYMTSTAIQPASIALSGDLRQFGISEFSAEPHREYRKTGGGLAVDGYLPIVPAGKDAKDNALSIIGEAATGAGTSDMYTALGAAGTSNAPLPAATPPAPGATPPTYTPNFDPGLAAYDANGNLALIRWISYMVGAEYYVPGVDGRLGLFANYGHMQSPNSHDFGGPHATVTDPVKGKTRESEDFFDAGLFVDPTKATRIGVDGALYDDHYVDGVHAKNYSLMASAFLFY